MVTLNKVYGVIFNNIDKKYYYLGEEDYEVGSLVLVNTERGLQLVKVVQILEDAETKEEMEKIERLATEEEYDAYLTNLKDADKALKKCIEYAKDLELEMNVVSAQFNLDRSQLLFNFTADGRIDFRELAKKLASIYHTRIELRQIGARDKAKEIGLTYEEPEMTSVPGVKELPLTLECKVVYKQAQDMNAMTKENKAKFYPQDVDSLFTGSNKDTHVAYYGEIVNAYVIE